MEKNEFFDTIEMMTSLKIILQTRREEWSFHSDTPKQLVELRIPGVVDEWVKGVAREVKIPEAVLMSCIISNLITKGIQKEAEEIKKDPKMLCAVCPENASCDKKEEKCQSLKQR